MIIRGGLRRVLIDAWICVFSRSDADRVGQSALEAERKRILEVAKQTVDSLAKQVKNKNDAIERYQQLMEKDRLKYEQRKQADEAEIERLNEKLNQVGPDSVHPLSSRLECSCSVCRIGWQGDDKNLHQLKSALGFLDDRPRLPPVCIQSWRVFLWKRMSHRGCSCRALCRRRT